MWRDLQEQAGFSFIDGGTGRFLSGVSQIFVRVSLGAQGFVSDDGTFRVTVSIVDVQRR